MLRSEFFECSYTHTHTPLASALISGVCSRQLSWTQDQCQLPSCLPKVSWKSIEGLGIEPVQQDCIRTCHNQLGLKSGKAQTFGAKAVSTRKELVKPASRHCPIARGLLVTGSRQCFSWKTWSAKETPMYKVVHLLLCNALSSPASAAVKILGLLNCGISRIVSTPFI